MRCSPRQLALCVWAAGSLVAICGCGAGSAKPISNPQGVLITTPPASVTVPPGSSATFTVVATGPGLNYQWSEDGSAIAGATGSSYTVADVTLSDSGESFAVTVSNSVDSFTSAPASLTVGARAPQAGDLRFQLVDSPSVADYGVLGGTSYSFTQSGGSAPDSTITPLQFNNGSCVPNVAYDCAWLVYVQPLPTGQTGLAANWDEGQYASLASDMQGDDSDDGSIAAANSVITSLDLQPANEAYAATWMSTTQTTGFTLQRQVVAPNAVGSTVATDAAQSRVITAVSFDDSIGQVDLLSYGWQADTTTTFDTDVLQVNPTIPDIESAAGTLAQDGYIITAFGGNFSDGFWLVGTKVDGDTMPRLVQIFDQNSAASSGSLAGYAEVATAVYLPEPGPEQYVFVYEK
jgi:hypothetical protein